MNQIFEFMKNGRSLRVLDQQFLETENAQIPDFVAVKSFSSELTGLKAADGSYYCFSNLPFYRGNYIWVKLCTDDAHQDHRYIRLGEMFDQNTVVVVAVDGDKVCCFAPVAKSANELKRFLYDIKRIFDENPDAYDLQAYDDFRRLAEWLYVHNPHKATKNAQ